MPGMRHPHGRADGARLDRGPEGGRQRDRLPRGRNHTVPDHRLERPLAPSGIRERGCRRERRRGRLPGSPPPRRAAPGRRPDHRRLRRRRRHLRHRPAGAVRSARAGPPVRVRLLRQRGLHEHRGSALRRHAVRRGDDDQPGGLDVVRQGAAAEGPDRDRGRTQDPIRRAVGGRPALAGPEREGGQGREGGRPGVPERACRLSARLGPRGADSRRRSSTARSRAASGRCSRSRTGRGGSPTGRPRSGRSSRGCARRSDSRICSRQRPTGCSTRSNSGSTRSGARSSNGAEAEACAA